MILNFVEFRRELEKINEWWLTEKVKEAERYPFKRTIFEEIKNELKSRRIIILLGPRRVGKSILIKQIIGDIIRNNTDPYSLLYYSLDDPTLFTHSNNLLKDLIDYYKENIAKGETKYVFLDEIHSSKDWFKWVKSYYDKFPDLKFILSGSSSLALQKDANKYLRGRTIEMELYPLNFKEFLELSDAEIKEIDISQEDIYKIDELKLKRLWYKIKAYYNEYLLVGGFPEWFEIKNLDNSVERWFLRLINDIPKKAIYEDVANLFGVKNPKILELVFAFIAANQSRVLAYETINEVARLDRLTLVNYIEFLKSSYLLIDILKFAGLKEQIKAKKKYLIIDQGLRNAILKDYQVKEDNIGFIIENLIGIKCYLSIRKRGQNIFYWKTNDEIDFVIDNKDILPIEVKYRSQIKPKEIRGLLNFMTKTKIKKGIIVTKDLYKREETGGKKIQFTPAWLFLLTELI
ncbi:MAG: ATP-binding protein [Candidatus Aminicenantia bacterium]